MGGLTTTAPRGSRTLLVLWGFIAGIGFAATAWVCTVSEDVAGSALLKVPGTQLVMGAAFAITVWGVVVAWPVNVSVGARRLAVLLLITVAGATTVPAIGLLLSGAYAAMGIALLQAAIFVVVLAGRVYQSSKDRTSRSVGAP